MNVERWDISKSSEVTSKVFLKFLYLQTLKVFLINDSTFYL